MVYYTKKNERYNLREHGRFASYPVYQKTDNKRVATLECYGDAVDFNMMVINSFGNFLTAPVPVFRYK